ncbi:MAG: type II toxin-antitoxin system MqsA family antitoxin, partial [Coriobacteriia bacterium]|nr:type II toxin-antitoxin system MqsA family antitoxin [Coriobacteriia bacterium]
ARLALALTQSDLARLLGVTTKAVGRWESGLVRQNRTADTLLRLLAAHPELVAETGFIAAEGRGPYGRKVGEE